MILPKPRRRRVIFVFTPLIDVLLLLVIFFMLSSQIAPYSLIPLGGVFSGDQSGNALLSSGNLVAGPMAVRVYHGYVGIGAERMAIVDLKTAAEDFRQQGIDRYLLIPAATADVQDVVSALEAFKAASAAEVTLLSPRQAVR